MKTVGEVAIVVGADIGPMNRELRKAEGGLKGFERSAADMAGALGKAFGIGAISAGAAATAVIGLTRASMQNIDALSKQARAAGLSVSAFQAMSLVAEEAGVATDDLSKILVKMQDNITSLSNGSKAQVEQFKRLGLSMSDLSGLSADEQFKKIAEALNGIQDPAAKTAAALDVFGRSGAQAINMLSGYGAAVDEAAAFQQRFGIAVSDLDAQQIEKANDAMGRMSLAASGLGNTLAVAFAPGLEAAANGIVAFVGHLIGARIELEEFFSTAERARAVLGDDLYNALDGNAAAIREGEDALDGLNNEAVRLEGIAANLAGEVRVFASGLELMNQAAGADVVEQLAGEIDDAREAFSESSITAEEFTEKLMSIQERAVGVANDLNGIDGADFSTVIGKLQGLATAIADTAAMARMLLSALPGGEDAAVPSGLGPEMAELYGRVPVGLGGVPAMESSPRPRAAPNDPDFGLPSVVKGGKGGGGGGLEAQFARRLETIVTSLQTEREVIDAWYEESLAVLQQASDAELAALGGKHEAMERLEEEHQRRLQGIRDMGNQWGVEAALAGGAEILGAMGAFNKKALKAASIFSAAQALISTYQGAAAELKKGTFGFASAAAVIAKGLAFVGAIKSAGSGAGGGAVAGGTSAVAQQPERPVQTLNFTVTNDPFGFGDRIIRQIAAQLNEAQRNGSTIRAVVN